MTLHRRDFVIGSGAVLSVASLKAGCGSAPYVQSRAVDGTTPGNTEDPPIVTVLRYGITAPSAHNTQPWCFELVSDTEARLLTDPDRLLPLTDPPNRQIHISHGTLLEMVAITASAMGHRAEITLEPEGAVTPATYGQRATASIRLVADPAVTEDPLFTEVPRRRSSRLAHHPQPPTADEIRSVVGAGTRPSVSTALRVDDLEPITDIVQRAMAVEARDEELYGETLTWFRFSREEVREKGDGLNLQTSGADSFMARTFLSPRTFLRRSNVRRFLRRFDAIAETTQGYLTLTTPTNTMADWLRAGRSYLRAQLTALLSGLRFHPVSQALQELEGMAPLAEELAVHYPVPEPGKLQMLVRVGRTDAPAVSPRRPLGAMIV